MTEHTITFDRTTGEVVAIYNDALREVFDALGKPNIQRASHVEPGDDGLWWVDLTPVGFNVKLGPYKLRADALAAEVDKLHELGY